MSAGELAWRTAATLRSTGKTRAASPASAPTRSGGVDRIHGAQARAWSASITPSKALYESASRS